jgi:hypothetical protein
MRSLDRRKKSVTVKKRNFLPLGIDKQKNDINFLV